MKKTVQFFLSGFLGVAFSAAQESPLTFAVDSESFDGDADALSLSVETRDSSSLGSHPKPSPKAAPSHDLGEFVFRADTVRSFRNERKVRSENQTQRVAGVVSFDFFNEDLDHDPSVGRFAPAAGFSFGFDSTELAETFSGVNVGGDNGQETFLVVRDNLPVQLSPEQTRGSDVLELVGERRFHSPHGTRTATFSLQLVDRSGTAFSSDRLPHEIDFSAFDHAVLFYTSETFDNSHPKAHLVREAGLRANVTSFHPRTDEEPTLTVIAHPVNEGNGLLPVIFELSSPARGGERFTLKLDSGEANEAEDFQAAHQVIEFEPNESIRTVNFILIDDAVIEPNETFHLLLFDPHGLVLAESDITLTIHNDDTVLDAFGSSFGLAGDQRNVTSDDDGDGLSLLAEFGFNLDPTQARQSVYEPDQVLAEGESPSGLPRLVIHGDRIKYVFPRRTDVEFQVRYIAEFSTDAINYHPLQGESTHPLTEGWEEVSYLLGEGEAAALPTLLLRVRLEFHQ